MRVTTANAYNTRIENLGQRQSEMLEANERMTSGKRVARASDDPTNAARAERAIAVVQRSDANQRAREASRNAMQLAESSLGDAGELLQQVRETMVAAGNGSYSDGERSALASKLVELRKQLLAVANRSDGAGGFLFGGQGATQQPFIDAAGGVQFRGSPGGLNVASDEKLPLTLDGNAPWLKAATGNGVFETRATSSTAWIDAGHVTAPAQLTGGNYAVQFSSGAGGTTYSVTRDGNPTSLTNVAYESGKRIEIDGMGFSISGNPAPGDSFSAVPSQKTLSVFDTIDQAITDLKASGRTPSQAMQTTQRTLRDLDASANSLQQLRTLVGESLKRADSFEDRVAGHKLYGKTEESNATDLDMVQAISDFQNQQAGYDAALKSYASVQRMSLFQYIS